MIYAKFNKDGSIDQLAIDESINQGNNNVNTLLASFNDISGLDTYTCKAEFELPDESVVEVSGSYGTILPNQQGFSFPIPNTVTKYAGVVRTVVKLTKDDATLYTYQIGLKVNKTSFVYQEPEDEEEE